MKAVPGAFHLKPKKWLGDEDEDEYKLKAVR